MFDQATIYYLISVSLPFITFLVCFPFWIIHGSDPLIKKTVVPEFEIPENLSPLEMGCILKKGDFNPEAFTATIINLAAKGYLKIEKIVSPKLIAPNDFNLIRTERKNAGDLYFLEEDSLNKIFGGNKVVQFSNFKQFFGRRAHFISKRVLFDLASRGIVYPNGAFYGSAMIFFGVLIILISLFIYKFSLLASSLLLSGLIIFSFGLLMGRLTEKGAELKARIKGFELYLKIAEHDRSHFHEEIGEVSKFLPYAILFGLANKWFEDLKIVYSSYDGALSSSPINKIKENNQ
jgi:uncharacterized membrane protein